MASKIPFETSFNPFASLVGVLKYNNLPTGEVMAVNVCIFVRFYGMNVIKLLLLLLLFSLFACCLFVCFLFFFLGGGSFPGVVGWVKEKITTK